MENDESFELDFKDIINIMKKKFYIIVGAVILSVLIGFIYSQYFVKPIYEANISYIVGGNADGDTTKLDYNQLNIYQNLTSTYASIITTIEVAQKTIDSIGIKTTPQQLLKRISVTPQEKTQIIHLRVQGDSVQEVKEITNGISSAFQEKSKNIYPGVDIQVLDSTSVSLAGKNSSMLTNLIYSFVLGIVCSVGLIFVRELLNQTVKKKEDVMNFFETAIIGNIPKNKFPIVSMEPNGKKKILQYYFEAFRMLRTNIEFAANKNNVKSIAVTSSISGEGKTVTACTLAVMMANEGKKTIIVDCDLKKSSVHKFFNLDNDIGLQNILGIGKNLQLAIMDTSIENLSAITSGYNNEGSTEIITSENIKHLINNLKSSYDCIIIDTPSIGLIADAQIVSGAADGCLMIVGLREVERKELEETKSILKNADIKLLGIVTNKADRVQLHYYEEPKIKYKSKERSKEHKEYKSNETIGI